LRATYNSLVRARKRGRNSTFDIYETKQGWVAEKDFLVLAKHLQARNIDPSLYLKIMFLYGRYSDTIKIPPTPWLRKITTIDIFRWLVRRERKKFERPEDYEKHINEEKWDADHIRKEISDAAKTMNPLRRRYNLSLAEATLVQLPVLSPWFLAVNQPFLDRGGIKMLDAEDRSAVRQCLSYLARRPSLYKVATGTFRKVTSF
jgi:hypothetical protein